VNAANSGAVGFRKGLKMFQQMQIPVLGIVENMSYFIPPDMPDKQYDILAGGGKDSSRTKCAVAGLCAARDIAA